MRNLEIKPATRMVGLLLAAVTLSGCVEEGLKSGDAILLWALGPLIVVAGAGIGFIKSARSRQLAAWDLREPNPPDINPIRTRFFVSVGMLVFAFAAFNVFGLKNADPAQVTTNILTFLLGTGVGALIAYIVGKRLAE